MVSVLVLCSACMYVCTVYVCMCKFYDCLPNAGEMFWMFLSYHTAAGPLVNSCEWNCYMLEDGVLVLNLATEFSVGVCMCMRYVCMHMLQQYLMQKR